MNQNNGKVIRYRGDVYRKVTIQGDGSKKVTFHVGSPDARGTTGGSDKCKLLIYLLDHVGETFDKSNLAKKIGINEKAMSMNANSFRVDFGDSRCFVFVVEGRGKGYVKYGLRKKGVY